MEAAPYVAILVGHNLERPGKVAVSGISEFTFNSRLASQVQTELAALGVPAKVYYRYRMYQLKKEMGQVVNAINSDGCLAVVDLHFNSAPSEHAGRFSGAGAKHWPGSTGGAKLANLLSRKAAEALGLKNRGPKPQEVSSSGKPLYSLRDTNGWAAILESHFGDNKTDHAAALTALESGALATAIALAIVEFKKEG